MRLRRPTPGSRSRQTRLLAAASATAQGLGDAAKKEQKRREAKPTSSKTYAQDDLKGLPPVANEGTTSGATGASPSGAAPSTPQPATKSADAEAEKRAQDEKAWRGPEPRLRVNGSSWRERSTRRLLR